MGGIVDITKVLMASVGKGIDPKHLTNPRPFELLGCDVFVHPVPDIPDGDAILMHLLGAYPFDGPSTYEYYGRFNVDFPEGMSKGSLYPEVTTNYAAADGFTYDVPCFIPGATGIGAVEEVQCLAGFVPPVINDAVPCVKQCPVAVYSKSEYDIIYYGHIVPSSLGFLLNGFMSATWLVGEASQFAKVPFEIKTAVTIGLLYALIDTIPSAVLKFGVACIHDTAEEIGSSWMCALNRAAPYLLMTIMTSFCSLTYSLFNSLKDEDIHNKSAAQKIGIVAVPFVFMVLGYYFDSDLNFSTDTENGNLNLVRHSVGCNMRFENELTEWCLLKAPLFVFGGLAAAFSVAALLIFAKLEKKLKRASAFASQKRRILWMGLSVSLCMMTSLIASALTSATLEEFSRTQDQLLTCKSAANTLVHDFEAYGYQSTSGSYAVCPRESIIQTFAVGYVGTEEKPEFCQSDCYWVRLIV
jgi:hypothetical protein